MKHGMKRLSAILQLLKTGHLPALVPARKAPRNRQLLRRGKPPHLLHAHVLVRARSWPSH